MAGRSKLESIKKRLDIEHLDLETRRKMFEDLKRVGGKVIDLDAEEKPAKSMGLTASRLGTSAQSRKSHLSTKKTTNLKKHSSVPQSVKVPVLEKTNESTPSVFTLWSVKLNCILSWIFNFSGTNFRHRFINLVLVRYKNALLSLKTFVDPVFSVNNLQSLEFREQFYRTNSLIDYELAYRIFSLYNDNLFKIIERTMHKGVSIAKEDLSQLFADLYILKPHATSIRVSYLLVLQKFARFAPESSAKNYSQDKIDRLFNFIWDHFYWEMDNLINYYCTSESIVKKKVFTVLEYLNIANVGQVGSLVEEWKKIHMLKDIKDEEESNNSSEDSVSSDSDNVANIDFPNEVVREGVQFLIKSVNFDVYYKRFKEGNDLRSLFQPSDKLLYTYAIVDFFDSEFSFLWNSVINFYVMSDGSIGRYDPKKELSNLNNRLNQFYELINDYLRLLRNHTELSRTKTAVQRLHAEQKEKELSRASYNIRNTLSKLMQEYDDIFSRVISIQDSGENIVGNWNEPIVLPVKNQNKIVSGMPVKDAIFLAQMIVRTTAWLLNRSDLSGLGGRLIHPQIIPQTLLAE